MTEKQLRMLISEDFINFEILNKLHKIGFGIITPKLDIIPCSPLKHVETLCKFNKKWKQMLDDAKGDEEKARKIKNDYSKTDASKHGFEWHEYENDYNAAISKPSSIRTNIVIDAYDLGYYRIGIFEGAYTIEIEGRNTKNNRAIKETAKEIAEYFESKFGNPYDVELKNFEGYYDRSKLTTHYSIIENKLRYVIRSIISESFLGIKSKADKRQDDFIKKKEIYSKFKKDALGLAYKFMEVAEFDIEMISAGNVSDKRTRALEKAVDAATVMSDVEDKFDPTLSDFDDNDIGKKKTSYWKKKFESAQKVFSKSINDYLTIIADMESNDDEISVDDKQTKKIIDKEFGRKKQIEALKTLKAEKMRLNSQLDSELSGLKNINAGERYGVTKYMNMFLSKILIGKSSQEIMNLGSEILSNIELD